LDANNRSVNDVQAKTMSGMLRRCRFIQHNIECDVRLRILQQNQTLKHRSTLKPETAEGIWKWGQTITSAEREPITRVWGLAPWTLAGFTSLCQKQL